jgi:hypothetical protein
MLSIIGNVKLTACLLGGLLLSACSRNIQNPEAVRQGVVDYLNQRKAQTGLDMTSMDIVVTSVAFEKDQAHATLSFRPKGAANGMTMNYTLEQKGSQWVVKGRADSGPNAHGAGGMPPAGGALPEGHAPTGGDTIPGMPHSQLPGGGGAQPLPSGHPPVGAPGSKPE